MDFSAHDDFEFGVGLPSDESETGGNGNDGDEYDALNDETFGGPIDAIPKDLSDYAANSLILELEESSLHDKHDEPGPSTAFERQNHMFNWSADFNNRKVNVDEQTKALQAQQEALRNVQDIWNQGSAGFEKLSEQMGFPTSFGNMMNVFGKTSTNIPNPVKMGIPEPPFGLSRPRQVLTLDEIERQQLMKTGAVLNHNDMPSFPRTPGDNVGLNQKEEFFSMMPGAVHMPESFFPHHYSHPSVSSTADWVRPPSPPSEKPSVLKSALTAEELERKMIEEYDRKRETPTDFSNVPASTAGPSVNQSHVSHGFPNAPFSSMPPPPMTPMVLQQMWAQFQQMTLANMTSNNVPMDQIPPWLHSPMPPPAFVAHMMSRMPFPPGMPPPPMMQPIPQQNPNLPCSSSTFSRPNQHGPVHPQMGEVQSQRSNRSGSSTPGSTTSSRRTRKDGMPSLRTITDFACDPFAGFMSKKEREWLIKIQLIQCLGTGDKYVDDYYYTMWRQSNQLAKRPADWNQPKIQSKYYNLEETYTSNYIPPTFSGVLGKPTHATTSFPRQCFKLLDIQTADDEEESLGGPIRDGKRKLRNILLTIENAYFLQLECDDLRRKLELQPDLSHVIEEKLQTIYAMTMNEANIPTTMLISKGRHLINRVLNMAPSYLKMQILGNVFNTLRKYSKKVSNMAYNDFIHTAVAAFVEVDINEFRKFFDLAIADRFKETLNYSSFSQNLFTALLLACAKRRFQVDHSVSSSSICEYLQCERKVFNGLGNKYYELFTLDEMRILKNWLISLEIRTPGTVADNFLTCVASKI